MSSFVSDTYFELPEQSSNVATPGAGQARLFIKNDQSINVIFDDDTVVDLTAATASTLSDLTDTNLSTLSDGQVLTYVTPPGEWQNTTFNIQNIANVNITSVLNDQVLQYDTGSGEWRNETLSISTTLSGLTDTTLTTPGQGDTLVRGSSDWINRPYNPTAYAFLDNDSVSPLAVNDQIAPSGGFHILDLSLSDTQHESLGSSSLFTTNGGIDMFRTPVGADDALGTMHCVLGINAGAYFGTASFQLWLKQESVGTSPTTTIGASEILIFDGDPVLVPTGNISFLHFNIPIYGADTSGAQQFYLVFENQGDVFSVTWRIMMVWHENQ